MGTTADKLGYLKGTKDAIKSSISSKGVSVSDEDTFRSYAEKIASIQTGMQSLGGGVIPASTMSFSIAIPQGAKYFLLKIQMTIGTSIFVDIESVVGISDHFTINGSTFYVSRDPMMNSMSVSSPSASIEGSFFSYEFFK